MNREWLAPLTGVAFIALAAVFLVFFGAYLRKVLRAAEGEAGGALALTRRAL